MDKNYLSAQRAAQAERALRLGRAAEAYRVFYPSVSCWSIFEDCQALGMVPNRRHLYCQGTSDKNALTPNSDTPYGVVLIDATDGPIVLELPAGPVIGVLNDWYFQEAGNVGMPGPDGGKGGKYLIAGPGYRGQLPGDGYFVVRPATNHCLAAIRAVPQPGQTAKALALLAGIRTYPLGEPDLSQMVDMTSRTFAVTPVFRERTLDYWRAVHQIINDDVPVDRFYLEYGRLAAVGIKRGMPFPEDGDSQALLTEASAIALEQMKAEAFSSTRPDRLVWPDRQWEWAGLVVDTGFMAPGYMDLYARDRWFYQATLSTHRMFPRKAGVGSIYLLGVKDGHGQPLDGGNTYRLTVPCPVPADQFWSLTVYDVKNRSQINTDQRRAALSSLSGQLPMSGSQGVDLYVGPAAPKGMEHRWIKSIPGEGWFCYLRLYGPGQAAFDGSWQPSDWAIV